MVFVKGKNFNQKTGEDVICPNCGKKHYRQNWEKRAGRGLCCCQKCSNEHKIGKHLSENHKKKLSKIAKKKGFGKWMTGKKLSKTTRAKMSLRMEGGGNINWKGGLVLNSPGYVMVYVPDHPFANNHGYVREHRLVMEKYLGRYLKPTEVVHHSDGNKKNNNLYNLKLYNSNTLHMRIEHWGQKINI